MLKKESRAAWLGLFAWFLVTAGNAGAGVLCIEEHCHAMMAPCSASGCGEASADAGRQSLRRLPQAMPVILQTTEHCGGCGDILISADATSPRSTGDSLKRLIRSHRQPATMLSRVYDHEAFRTGRSLPGVEIPSPRTPVTASLCSVILLI